jgi:cyclopropane fatty-acyl-phospholipid synthase-like methyltransferase
MDKYHAESTRRNRTPILEVLKKEIEGSKKLLEIGSGTGQHAVYFSKKLPQILWQTSDRSINHESINYWIKRYNLKNLLLPLDIEIGVNEKNINDIFDCVFSSNTSHIMSLENVKRLFALVGKVLNKNGKFFLYGPFKINLEFTTKSNEDFHQKLKAENKLMGLRDIEELDNYAIENNMQNHAFYEMPANNYLSIWKKLPV